MPSSAVAKRRQSHLKTSTPSKVSSVARGTLSKAPTLSATGLKTNLKIGQHGELPEQKFLITPALATHILSKHNGRNRSINDAHLMSLVRDIKQGHWIEGTGTMLLFSRDGQLMDGQHRLAAIAKAGTPLALSLKFGLDAAAQRVIDTGRKRTYSDLIAMTEGLDAKYKTERASVTRLLYGFLHDQQRPHVYTNNNKPTQSDLYEVALELGDDINEAVSMVLGPGAVQKVLIGSYAAFVAVLAKHSKHADRAEEFFKLLGTGANMSANDPIMVVRNRLLIREEFRSQKTKDRTIGLLIKCWNHWVKGDSVTNKMQTPDHLVPMVGLTKLGSQAVYT